jgi:hypothetical protein
MRGAPIPHTEIAAKGHAIAETLFAVEAARALYYRAISEAQVDPPLEAVQRARAAHVIVQHVVGSVPGRLYEPEESRGEAQEGVVHGREQTRWQHLRVVGETNTSWSDRLTPYLAATIDAMGYPLRFRKNG